ncbi:hypothetical protein L596_015531 [Steinernema carpocapsae]|uniref:Secreted protein n=1 Tax=Steinernema carpocapsae TaxID=34508 RepID=A0A4U5NG92_STECR|nr:hypothetical protein L596_015531 [Steinernema carpocapsae]
MITVPIAVVLFVATFASIVFCSKKKSSVTAPNITSGAASVATPKEVVKSEMKPSAPVTPVPGAVGRSQVGEMDAADGQYEDVTVG